MHAILSTKRSLVEIKYRNNKEARIFLMIESMFINIEIQKTRKTKTVGALIHGHRNQVWNPYMKEEIKKGMEEIECNSYKK